MKRLPNRTAGNFPLLVTVIKGATTGGSGGSGAPNFCLDPSNILDKFFLGGVRVQYLSCIFTYFAMILQLSEFTRFKSVTRGAESNAVDATNAIPRLSVQNSVPLFPASSCFLSVSGTKMYPF